MRHGFRNLALTAALFGLSLSMASQAHAQSDAQKALIEKARALEARGRGDMAAQSWQQVLLADPNNIEAITGLARYSKLNGNTTQAKIYIERLRQLSPNDPNIAKLEAMNSTMVLNAKLAEAGNLAREGKYAEAMKIYRDAYGDHPPDGDIALAYYETEAATEAGKLHAIDGLKTLARRYPGDPRYSVTLGRILTYDPKTRAEGVRILREHPQDASAQAALRQALVWDSQNPASSGEIRQYLKQHSDPELEAKLKETEERQVKVQSGLAQTADERAAYAAMGANKLDEAQALFNAILQKQPDNPRALAGLGFLRMKQNNFAGAISFLEQAQQNGLRVPEVQSALQTSRFWFTVQEGTTALEQKKLDLAVSKYKAALALRPNSPEALGGLGGALLTQQQPAQAIGVYQQYVRVAPKSADGWRGLFMAQVQAGNPRAALATTKNFPPSVKASLSKDPEYLSVLASAYSATGQDALARQTLAEALNLPFPDNGKTIKGSTRLQYAGVLQQTNHLDQAAALYNQIIADDPGNVNAWQGLVNVQHQMNLDSDAVSSVERMPPATYDAALRDPGFLMTLAAIYQQQNQFEVAQGFLERAAKIESVGGQQPSVPLQLQLAGIYLQRNLPDKAYAIYRKVLIDNPDRTDAWKGLLNALHQTGHDKEALLQIQQIPPAVRTQLAGDVQYQETAAGIYAATGDQVHALEALRMVQAHYASQHLTPPADIQIQNAWLLFNARDDRALYPALMQLGSRTDLTDAQRRQIQTVWTSWSVRRAGDAADAGNNARALEILNAASQAFPDNPDVSKALAGGYLRAGQSKQAVAIYKSLDMSNADVADYRGAIGAALAADDKTQAELWLREALQKYSNDPQVLGLAARYEQARGDNAKAAEYWRASLAAMPVVNPANRLAHTLAQADGNKPVKQQATPQDLATLLNPNADAPAPKPPAPVIPSYTTDPNYATAPVHVDTNAGGGYGQTANPSSGSKKNSTPPPASTPKLSDYNPQASQPQSYVAPQNVVTPSPQGSRVASVPSSTSSATASNTKHATTSKAATGKTSGSQTYSGRMSLPPGEETITSTDVPQQTGSHGAPNNTSNGIPQAGTQRITLTPLPPTAATPAPVFRPSPVAVATTDDGTPMLRYVPNAATGDSTISTGARVSSEPVFATVQYTPSAQEAAQGAYSAPPKQQAPLPPPVTTPAPAQQTTAPVPTLTPARKPKKSTKSSSTSSSAAPTYQAETQVAPVPAAEQQSQGITDDQLIQRNLPPLRGPSPKSKPLVRSVDPRQEAEQQLATIEGGYSPWFGGTGLVSHRSGDSGFDRLTALEAPFETSAPLGTGARMTVIVRPAFLDAGKADGNSTQRLGSLPVGAIFAQQNASGVGGELQITSPNLGGSAGYTPSGFLVSNIIGRAYWRPAAGPVSLTFVRDSIKDTQLSYSGLRDPGQATPSFPGPIWGGVIANAGAIRYARGNAYSGFYVGGGGQYITGAHVVTNNQFNGTAGAYWRVLALPEYGELTVGANFFGMHYAHNQRSFTYGNGGYFSPNAYFLANMPISWNGHYGVNFHYTITAGLGMQAFQESSEPLFPLDTALQTTNGNATIPSTSNVGGNYDLRAEGAYSLSDHWYIGGFLNLNNSRDYNSQTAGFFVRYLTRPQLPTTLGPTGLFPYDGLRPMLVP